MLYEKLKSDLTEAMKGRREFEVGLLRMMLAALHNRALEKRAKSGVEVPITEEEVAEVLHKEAKKRREAAVLFETGSRADLRDKEIKEAGMIESYLPKAMDAAELEEIVKKVVAGGAKDFGQAMKEVMKAAGGRADGKAAGELVKKLLGQ